MTRIILLCMAAFAMICLLSAETSPPKSTKRGSQSAHKSATKAANSPTVKSSAASSAAGKGATAKSTTSQSTSTKSISKRKGNTTARRTVRSYQQTPTPERYQEIQQALAKKGYFQDEANGQWGTSSVEALKRFQADQNLMPDGKINSLSLIALGLGPKRLTAQSKSANPPPPPAPAPQ